MKKSHISLEAIWTSSTLFLVVSVLASCAFSPPSEQAAYSPKERVYFRPYDEVWRATQLAFANYPIKMNNMDLGITETDYVKGDRIWSPPHLKNKTSTGVKYQITARIIAGRSKKRRGTKVSVFKKVEKRRDFFAEVEKIPSDGLEENALLYRIGREIKIENALQKLQKRTNQ